ncbi:hypothetical protein Tco_1189042, partial [Tanacetum coccineum]
MSYPRFTKIIINHFLSQHKSLAKLKHLHTHTIKDDGVVNRLKFVRIDVHKILYWLNYSQKESRGKGSQGKKAAVSLKPASVEVSDESDSELIVTESNPEPARRRPLGIALRDTSSVSKKMSHDPSQKLKGVQTLTLEEQLATDTMQAVKASRKSNRSQALTRGPSEGTSVSPRVSNKSTVIPATSSEGTGTKPGVLVYFDEDEEKKDDDDDDKGIDIEETGDEETDDEFVRDDVDKEIKDAEVAESGNGDEEIFDTAKADAKMTKEVKDDNKKAKLPTSSSSLFVSSGFGNQFPNLYFDQSTVGTLKDYADAKINSLL